ncbi:MAG: hypothetical protein U1G05_00065 [Kiritimatiellia bacterium]
MTTPARLKAIKLVQEMLNDATTDWLARQAANGRSLDEVKAEVTAAEPRVQALIAGALDTLEPLIARLALLEAEDREEGGSSDHEARLLDALHRSGRTALHPTSDWWPT